MLALRVRTEAGQELLWITVPVAVGETPDGSRFTLQGRMSAPRKGTDTEETSQMLATALHAVLGESNLPLASAASVVLCEVEVPSGAVVPSPSIAFEHAIHLSLLKLEFLDIGEGGRARGRPLVDLQRWGLLPEALANRLVPGENEPRRRVASKREVVECFKRDELQALADEHELVVEDRRVNEHLVDAVVRAKRVRVADALARLSRDRLKEICVALELDDTGREKAALVDRICGDDRTNESDADETEGQVEQNAAEILARLVPALEVADGGTGWPLRGSLRIADQAFDVDIYCRMIGGSARGNSLERRLQNPSQNSPIIDEPNRYELLFGIWNEQGAEKEVIVAFEAHRRLDKTTRFSVFMPLSLLEQAADTGFATHENNRSETIYAFRPDNIQRYFQAFLVNEIGRTSKSEPAPKPQVVTPTVDAPQGADSVYIRPRVGMYSAFARLNYKPWFALAEFIDNSIQSFLQNRKQLVEAGHDGPMVIDVNVDENEISVTDRAGGISWKDFPRAFSPASPPDDASGLSEFGLGMKAAACWFSKKWSVRTSALGESTERTVVFDIPRISREGIENIPIETRPSRESDHFTVVTMTDLRVHPRGRTLAKIRDHLSSIYRVLISEGVVKIRLTTGTDASELCYRVPELLQAPFYLRPMDPAILWRTDFAVDFHDRKVTGWAGILKTGSHQHAGFSVFRRRRLVDGSIGETYKPSAIFGSPNSFESQRVIGELFVEGFDVTHTKDGIQWHGYEDELVESLGRKLNTPKLPLLDQASGYRARTRAASLKVDFGVEALDATAEALATSPAIAIIPATEGTPTDAGIHLAPAQVLQRKDFRVRMKREDQYWEVQLNLVRDAVAPFYSVASFSREGQQSITVEVNLDHEFSIQFINDSEALLQPLLRFIAALAIGEIIARESGVKGAGVVRTNANELLRNILKAGAEHGEA